MNKIIVVAGLIFLIAGIALVFPSTDETHTTIQEIQKWDSIWPPTLNPPPQPNNSTFWGRYMQRGNWYELDLSSNSSVRVTISIMLQQSQTKTPIFDQVGTRFTQKVGIGFEGTYQVDIINEGTSPASIWGHATAMKEVTINSKIYPYLPWGILMAIAGLALTIFGVSRKSKKRVSKKKA